jgi:hypothetical protein
LAIITAGPCWLIASILVAAERTGAIGSASAKSPAR